MMPHYATGATVFQSLPFIPHPKQTMHPFAAALFLVLAGCLGASEPEAPEPEPTSEPADGASVVVPPPSPAAPETPPPPPPHPTFSGTRRAIPETMRAKMIGVTWQEGCPLHLDDLALLEVVHWTMDDTVAQGQLVVAATQADALLDVFAALFDARFPIHQMRPAHEFGGSDDASMAANNTSAFNCRKKTGGISWSEHSYGEAIDINTVQNPYVRGTRVLPAEGRPYVERDPTVPGLIVADGPVVAAFRAVGWKWGGHWRSLKDYQHFSASGR